MTWLDKFLFLSIGLGSILYFMLKKINEWVFLWIGEC